VNGIEEIRRAFREKPADKWLIWEIALCEIALQFEEIAKELAKLNARLDATTSFPGKVSEKVFCVRQS